MPRFSIQPSCPGKAVARIGSTSQSQRRRHRGPSGLGLGFALRFLGFLLEYKLCPLEFSYILQVTYNHYSIFLLCRNNPPPFDVSVTAL